MSAYALIKQGVEVYKDLAQTGSDLSEISTTIIGHMGKFFDASEEVKKNAEQVKANPPKGKSLNSRALEAVMHEREMIKAEEDLLYFLRYQTPGLGAICTDFLEMRAKMRAEDERIEAEKKRPQRWPSNVGATSSGNGSCASPLRSPAWPSSVSLAGSCMASTWTTRNARSRTSSTGRNGIAAGAVTRSCATAGSCGRAPAWSRRTACRSKHLAVTQRCDNLITFS